MSNILLPQTPDFTNDKFSDDQLSCCDQNQQPQDLLGIINSQQQHQPNQTKLICSSSFLTPGYDQDYDDVLNVGLQSLDNQNDNEFFAEDSLEYEKRARQKEFSLKMANYMKEQETPGQDFPTGMNNDDSINCEVEIDQIKQNQMAPLQIQDVQDQLGHIYTHPQQYRDIQFDVDSNLDFQSNSAELFVNQSESYYNNADILNQSGIFGFSNFQNDHYDEMMMNNISFQNNSDYIFEQMQPQQLDHETIIKGENLERFYNITNEELNSQQKQVIELDLQEQQVSEKLSKGQQRKKRGAPFKGQVSDQKEEGFKYQRQQIFRDFKSYYEKRSYMIRFPTKKNKKRKVFHSPSDLEQEQRAITQQDAQLLFEKDLFPLINEEAQSGIIN